MLARLTAELSGRSNVTIECQGSSLGRLDRTWLADFAECCTGTVPSGGRAAKGGQADRVKIVFPTMEHVLQSPRGPEDFGTIFFQQKNWHQLGYPRELFSQCISVCGSGRALHSKVIAAFADAVPVWYYVGSANFTASAWGSFVKDRQKVLIANFEAGVVLSHPADASTLFPAGLFPYPYQRPLQKYRPSDLPWMQASL